MKKALTAMLAFGSTGCGTSDAECATAALLEDPGSARFQHVAARGDHVCGEVNGKSRDGTYGRYARFVYDAGSGRAVLEPSASVPPPPNAADGVCTKPQSYQTVSERFNCTLAPELEAERAARAEFDSLWSRACAG